MPENQEQQEDQEPLEGIIVDDFECKLSKVESLEDYFKIEQGPDGECRPCRLKPLASLYLGVLENAGDTEAAKKLSDAYESGHILTIAKCMDNIKGSAKEGIRTKLELLNCLGQSPIEDEDQEEAK